MAGYSPSASRPQGPQPSSLSLLNQSDSSLCSTFLCSLVSRADSKSLSNFETLYFTPSLQTLYFTPSLQRTKQKTLLVLIFTQIPAEQRIGVCKLVRRTKGTVHLLSALKLGDHGFTFLANWFDMEPSSDAPPSQTTPVTQAEPTVQTEPVATPTNAEALPPKPNDKTKVCDQIDRLMNVGTKWYCPGLKV
ncbi:hypothetical protein SO802_013102 [Lithocarpus litseifolius]|uniref:Uncharacterized protein n=1 Tax=Lithocarpus litseifolius TaxID=425828 RepID=A0AAW2DA68_9ROSI